MYIYIYTHICVCIYMIYIYIHIHIYIVSTHIRNLEPRPEFYKKTRDISVRRHGTHTEVRTLVQHADPALSLSELHLRTGRLGGKRWGLWIYWSYAIAYWYVCIYIYIYGPCLNDCTQFSVKIITTSLRPH